jgi:protein-S-isoprenylcysteine O-methyltransferase Ste14
VIPTYKIILFLLITAILASISRASLTKPRSHGFPRFFAWELILALCLLRVEAWFRDPFSWHQLLSWLLLLISLFLVIHGVWLLRQVGRQDARRDDSPMLAFEKTSRLVTLGAYRYIRHPLYSSLLFLTWGIFFKSPDWLGGILSVLSTLALVATARAEEAEDMRFFEEEYREYMKRTRMFIPFVF